MNIASSEAPVSAAIERSYLRTFTNLVAGLEEGQLNIDASNTLEEIVMLANEALQREQPMKATMTLTIVFKAINGVVEINGNLKTKLPPPRRRASLLHVAAGKYLTPMDPRQHLLPLRSVEVDTPVFRSVNEDKR